MKPLLVQKKLQGQLTLALLWMSPLQVWIKFLLAQTLLLK